ncbi:hypothetical protein ACFX2J_033026 [Malus domestica]|uniref:serpin-ZX-like n=1 Tax=Malus domestica TaxID=3750 RepID=UPI00397606EF
MASPLKLISCSLFLFFSFIFWSKKPPIHPNIIAKTLTTPPVQLPVIARDRDLSDLRIFVRSQTAAAMRITKPLLLSEAKDKNMVFSPLSIHIVLSLIVAGTKGPARDQLLSFLKSNSTAELNALAADLVLLVLADGSASGGPRLSFANGLWVDESLSIKPSFKEAVAVFYKAVADKVDFQNKADEVRIKVNSWAQGKTGGLIKEFLPPASINGATRLVFANALYFKGVWEEKFDALNTKEHDFNLLDGSSVRAHFMTSDKWQFVRAFDGFKILQLPYRQGGEEEGKPPRRRFSMYLILPDAEDGLPGLVDKVCSGSDFLNRHQPYGKVEVGDFKIPRFKFSSDLEASKTLKDLGLVLPFTSELTEMVNWLPSGDAFNMLHKSCIEVNEEGTEAAAITGILAGSSLNPPDKIDFVADHPFMFVIREEITGTVLFIGQVLNPLAG